MNRISKLEVDQEKLLGCSMGRRHTEHRARDLGQSQGPVSSQGAPEVGTGWCLERMANNFLKLLGAIKGIQEAPCLPKLKHEHSCQNVMTWK